MTQVLARKWRPKSFQELVGQEHVVRALTNALTDQRLHHAYLFTGTRGCGKTTLARIVAKALNCETGVTATPCGKCAACTEIDAGRFVDLIELDAASNTSIDDMRVLLENAVYAPTVARYKVYIIDEVHMLSKSAFNAMLKTLEEPPEHVKFVLATTDPQKIPVTVLSRCLQFNLKQIPQPQIQARLAHVLAEEGLEAEPAALALIARSAGGSLRDALSLLDQAIAHGAGKVDVASTRAMLGTVDQTYLHAILRALAAGDGAKLIAEADAMAERSLSFETALQDMGTLLHRLALVQIVPQLAADDDPDAPVLRELSGLFGAEELQLYYQIAVQARNEIGLAPDEYAGFSMALLRMLAFAPGSAGGAPQRVERPVRSQPAAGGQTSARSLPPASSGSGAVGPDPGLKSAPVEKPGSDPARENRGPTPASGPTPTAAAENHAASPSPTADFSANWSQILERIGVVGMAAMLAKNCVMTKLTPDRIELTLPKAHEKLLEGAHKDRLKAALQKHFGANLHVAITVGTSNGNSPAQIAQRDREREQAQAIETIESDPFVQDLVENFGGEVKAIKPLQ